MKPHRIAGTRDGDAGGEAELIGLALGNGRVCRTDHVSVAIFRVPNPNFESLEDTYKDMINYASFAVSYLRGKMEGQDTNRDMFNKPISRQKAREQLENTNVAE